MRAGHREVAAIAREGTLAYGTEGVPMSDEADRLIAAALRDHARIPASPGLRRTLEQR